jgi:ABC-2 type transport system ATP-binding protein
MATHVGIINFGNLLFQGSIKDMEAISQPSIHIETNNNTEAASYLNNAGINITNVTDAAVTVPFASREQMAELNRQLVQQSFTVYAIHKVQKDLEKLFLDITKKPLS